MEIFTFISCKFHLFFIANESVPNHWPSGRRQAFDICEVFRNLAVLITMACKYTLWIQVVELHNNAEVNLSLLKVQMIKNSQLHLLY